MKKIRYLIIVCICLLLGKVIAQQQVSETEARNAAITTLYNKAEILSKSSNSNIETVNSFVNASGDTLLYEVVFQNRATILLSGSRACLPVLGYYIKDPNENGAIFDTTNNDVPCCLHTLLSDYTQEIERCFAKDTIDLYYENLWRYLQQPNFSKPHTKAVVSLNLTTKWGQNYSNLGGDCHAFNYYVTKTGGKKCACDERYCPAGCVAVAVAQIMKYWNYPVYLSENIEQYDWCNMSDSLIVEFEPNHPLNPTPFWINNPNYIKQRNAVARLIKDCGEATNTSYCVGNCSSSSSIINARHALVQHFEYNDRAVHRLKSSYLTNIEKWKNFIKEDLNNGRPVYYRSGGLNADGHAWVCYGYNSDDNFLFNWGWRGRYDGWFTLDGLSNINGHNYNVSQEAIFEIYPNTNQNYCNYTFSLADHFNSGGTHQDVPKTYMIIESAPETSPAAWRTITSGQSAEYVAHEAIILKPGFKAEADSHFVARIDPCDGCKSANVTVKSFVGGEEVEEELYIAVGDFEDEGAISEMITVADEPKVYPNPTSGLLTINTKNDNIFIQMIELYNTQGSKQYTFNGSYSSFQEIDISCLPSQVYILKIL